MRHVHGGKCVFFALQWTFTQCVFLCVGKACQHVEIFHFGGIDEWSEAGCCFLKQPSKENKQTNMHSTQQPHFRKWKVALSGHSVIFLVSLSPLSIKQSLCVYLSVCLWFWGASVYFCALCMRRRHYSVLITCEQQERQSHLQPQGNERVNVHEIWKKKSLVYPKLV